MVENSAALARQLIVLGVVALWLGTKVRGRRAYPMTWAVATALTLLVAAEIFENLTGPGAFLAALGNPTKMFLQSLMNLAGLAAFVVFTELSGDDRLCTDWRYVVRCVGCCYAASIATLAIIALWASVSDQVIDFGSYASMNAPSMLYSLIVRSALAAVMFWVAWWAMRGAITGRNWKLRPRSREGGEEAAFSAGPVRALHVADSVAMWMVALGTVFVGSAVAANAASSVLVKSGLMSTERNFFSTPAEQITAVVLIFGGLMFVLVFAKCRAALRWWCAWRLSTGLKAVHTITRAVYPEVILPVAAPVAAEQEAARPMRSSAAPPDERLRRCPRPSASEVMEFKFRRRRAECFDAITRLRPYIESGQSISDGSPLTIDFVEVLREVADPRIMFKDLAATKIVGTCGEIFQEETRELLKISQKVRRRRIMPPVDGTLLMKMKKVVTKQ